MGILKGGNNYNKELAIILRVGPVANCEYVFIVRIMLCAIRNTIVRFHHFASSILWA